MTSSPTVEGNALDLDSMLKRAAYEPARVYGTADFDELHGSSPPRPPVVVGKDWLAPGTGKWALRGPADRVAERAIERYGAVFDDRLDRLMDELMLLDRRVGQLSPRPETATVGGAVSLRVAIIRAPESDHKVIVPATPIAYAVRRYSDIVPTVGETVRGDYVVYCEVEGRTVAVVVGLPRSTRVERRGDG